MHIKIDKYYNNAGLGKLCVKRRRRRDRKSFTKAKRNEDSNIRWSLLSRIRLEFWKCYVHGDANNKAVYFVDNGIWWCIIYYYIVSWIKYIRCWTCVGCLFCPRFIWIYSIEKHEWHRRCRGSKWLSWSKNQNSTQVILANEIKKKQIKVKDMQSRCVAIESKLKKEIWFWFILLQIMLWYFRFWTLPLHILRKKLMSGFLRWQALAK